MGIPASQRLRIQSDFLEVRSSRHRIHCGPFIVQCDLTGSHLSAPPKLGVIASRRVGNAVKRNRGKRVFRELFRHHQNALPGGSRVVVVIRSGFDKHNFSDLEDRFLKACATLCSKMGQEKSPL
ncbi:MAG: ribonuclease P protein component [Verrucomicrobiota bacterium]